MATDSKPKKRGGRTRRVVRVERVPLLTRVQRLFESRAFGWGLIHAVLFFVLATSIGIWASSLREPAVGRVSAETSVTRVTVEIPDLNGTENRRERARQLSPQIFIAEGAAIDEIVSSIASLPAALAGVTDPEGVAPEIRDRFELSAESLAALAREAEAIGAWEASVQQLRDRLLRRPLLESEVFQRAVQHPAGRVELRSGTMAVRVPVEDLLNLGDPMRVRVEAVVIARRAGIPPALHNVIATRLERAGRSTYRLDDASSAEAADAASAAIPEQFQTYPEGVVIVRRGERITPAQGSLLIAERAAYTESSPLWRQWAERLSLAGGALAVTLGVAGYVVAYCHRIRRNPGRMAGLSVLMLGALTLAAGGVVLAPSLAPVMLVLPVVFAGGILAIAYDPRAALAVGTLLAVLVSFLLGGNLGTLATTEAGLAAAVWTLREVRARRDFMLMAGYAAAAMGLTAIGTGLGLLPVSRATVGQVLIDAAFLAASGPAISMLILFTLPTIENAFGITTGMRLIELRDPKQELLREIQQRAPGTYNHSLNVASIAETAADSIGADSLLTYVGGLYHDVGKINKPGYFVENQGDAPSKHEKLDPAMSLLVIVGHVKDGLEIAREHGLPRELMHFIEAHHGTTLVEYFYHLARQRAESEEETREVGIERAEALEVEYRYPGPKPKTREVAILMLADSVESATRALPDPTPARIDQLVRAIADKRLRDGQFDECDLTLRDLARISESISQSVSSIHHGRIAYPGDSVKKASDSGDRGADPGTEQADDRGRRLA